MKLVTEVQKEEKPVKLSMLNCDTHIKIIAERVGEPDNKQILLHIHNDGSIYRVGCIDESLGFQLDERGRILIN